jgi:hypothetical protein
VHFDRDKFVDPDELRVLCFGTPEEIAKYTDKASTADATVPKTEPVSAAEPAPMEPAEPQDVHQGLSTEELEQVAERGTESPVDLVDEPAAEPMEPEAPLAEEVAPEMEPEATVAPEEPVDAPEAPEEAEEVEEATVTDGTPEMVPPPPEEPVEEHQALELPEDWRRKSKTTLLGYAEALGLDVSSMPSNKQLVAMIEAATKGA